VHYIDMDGVEALDEIVRLIQTQGKDVYFTSLNPIVEEMLKESHFYKKLLEEKRVFERSSEALTKLGFKLR
jgi:MFS superfamily sulfate permease-like transporter